MPICTNFAEVWLRIGNENKVFVSLSSEQAALTKKGWNRRRTTRNLCWE